MQMTKATRFNGSEKMLSISEVAGRLGLAPVTVRAWAAARRIASVKLGRARRIPESEVSRLLQENLIPALPERSL